MTDRGWLLQVYQLADPAAQDTIAQTLSDTGQFTVDARSCERGHFLIVECPDPAQAIDVYEMVMMADSGAELIHSTRKRDERDKLVGEPAPVPS